MFSPILLPKSQANFRSKFGAQISEGVLPALIETLKLPEECAPERFPTDSLPHTNNK